MEPSSTRLFNGGADSDRVHEGRPSSDRAISSGQRANLFLHALWIRVEEQRYAWIIFAFVSLFALCLLSTKLLDLILQHDVMLIKQFAPWFYLTSFGRWKLFRGYRKEITVDTNIRNHALHYMDLPYTVGNAVGSQKLSARLSEISPDVLIQITAEGGRGKTTLAHFLLWRRLQRNQIPGQRSLLPVFLDGAAYTGNILRDINSTLRQRRAYVNESIVQAQLSAGNLVIIVDGYSEVREAFRSAAETTDIPTFVREHPDTAFLFTSRNALPLSILSSHSSFVTIQLRDIQPDTEALFLRQYLKNGTDSELVLQRINSNLPEIPRIPLMLALIAAVYESSGSVPNARTSLYSQYADKVLRPEVTGIDDPAGLYFALRQLVLKTFILSGGDRGCPLDTAIKIFGTLGADLANYDLRTSPLSLVNLLCRAGLLLRVGEYLRFFHDSFESYFAAGALISELRRDEYSLIAKCQHNERLKETWMFFIELINEAPDSSEARRRLSQALT